MAEPVILLASVRIDLILPKRCGFDGTTTVAEAFQHIADKCSLSVSMEGEEILAAHVGLFPALTTF